MTTFASTKVEMPAETSVAGTPHFAAIAAGLTALGFRGSAGVVGLK